MEFYKNKNGIKKYLKPKKLTPYALYEFTYPTYSHVRIYFINKRKKKKERKEKVTHQLH